MFNIEQLMGELSDKMEELEAPPDGAGLEEISTMLKSLTRNGSVSHPPRLDHDGSSSKVMEQEDMEPEQGIQMTTMMEKIGKMEKTVGILQTKSEEKDLEIKNLQSLLASEREGKIEMEAKVNCFEDVIWKMFNVVGSLNTRTAATEKVINKGKEDGGVTSKVDEAIKVLTKKIEDKITNGMETHEKLINEMVKASAKESSKGMETEIRSLHQNFEKNNSEITSLQSMLKSETESKTEMEAEIKCLRDDFQKMFNAVAALTTRTAATEESIKVINEEKQDPSVTSKLDEAIKVLTREIEDKFKNHESLINEIQRVQQSAKQSSKTVDTKIFELHKKSDKNYSEITNLLSLIASDREDKTKVESKLNYLYSAIRKAFNDVKTLTTRTVATEESIKVIHKDKEDGSTQVTSKKNEDGSTQVTSKKNEDGGTQVTSKENEDGGTQVTSKVDEAIKVLTREIARITNGLENQQGRLINDIQRLKESVEELEKRMESNLKDGRAKLTETMRTIKEAMEELENHIESDTQQLQLIFSETDTDPAGVTDQIQQLSEVRNLEALLGDGSDINDKILVITLDEDEQMEDHAAPQVQKDSPVASSPVGQEIGSKNMETLDCPSSTTTTATVQTQNVTHAVDDTKSGGIFCICGRKFISKSTLRCHIIYFTATDADKKFRCPHCPNKRFLRLGDLNAHQRRAHKINAGGCRRGCRKCGKTYASKKFVGHSKSCKGGQVRKRQETSRVITSSSPKPTSSRSTRLMGKTHGRDPTRPLFCLCGMKFSGKRNRNRHVAYHAMEKKYPCKYCDRRYELQCRLNYHVRRSHQDKLSELATGAVDAGQQEQNLVPSPNPPQLDSVPEGSDPDGGGESSQMPVIPYLCLAPCL